MLFGPKPQDLGKCPVCEEPLAVLELHGVEIDHCLECAGTWLDAGELEEIAERAGVASEEVAEALRGATDSGKRIHRRCPRCRKYLETVAIGGESAVEIDRCSKGHGFWFDRGEMCRLVSGASRGKTNAVAEFFADFLRYEVQTETPGD